MQLTINSLIQNEILARTEYMRRWLDPRRDIDKECGHPLNITTEDYHRMFLRGDLAGRIISLLPEESWSQVPQIYETEDQTSTEFEDAWKDLDKQFHLLTYLMRADILSGIGRFGVILVGINDGKDMMLPVEGVNPDTGEQTDAKEYELIYVRPLEEQLVKVHSLNPNQNSPRYGMPESYQLQFLNSVLGNESTLSVQCHWTRVVHLADNRTNSEVLGCPRLEKVFNRILDIHKITGGSAEMFWKGGFPGISLQSHPNVTEDAVLDVKATKEQLEAYMNGLQRYIATIGMDAKSLTVQVADPGPHVETQMRLVATALGIPWRVLIGSEAAKLASTQDILTWNRRLTRRREDYVSPFVIRPFVDRLLSFGILPPVRNIKEGYVIDWEDLNTPSDVEKAQVAKDRTTALFQYVTGGVDALIPPFHYLTLVMGLEEEEANSIIDDATMQSEILPKPTPPPAPGQPGQPAGRNGTPAVVPANNGH